MRVSVIALTVVVLISPAVLAGFSTRGVHDTVYETFVPEPADGASRERTVDINCGTNADKSRMKAGGEFAAQGENDHLPCWPTEAQDPVNGDSEPRNHLVSSSNHLWWKNGTVDTNTGLGEPVGASPPFYQCLATELTDEDGDGTPEPNPVDLRVTIQNPFPIADIDDDADPNTGPEPWRQGVLVSSGSFYVIPEILGEDADRVEAVWFGFLETTPTVNAAGENIGGGSDELCTNAPKQGVAASGVYYEYYRGDIHKEDGWKIPINTLLVPDNIYGAYLKFYGQLQEAPGSGTTDLPQPSPGGLELLGTGFSYAYVENDRDDSRYRSCTPTRVACTFQDTVPPWPLVRPGDTPMNVSDVDPNDDTTDESFQVIFGERIQLDSTATGITLTKSDTGDVVDLTGSWAECPGPRSGPCLDASDVDSVPLFTVPNAGVDDWGPRLVFNDVDIDPGDTLTINARDMHGNDATKTVVFEDPT